MGYDLRDIFLVHERNHRSRIERIINNYAGRVMDGKGRERKKGFRFEITFATVILISFTS